MRGSRHRLFLIILCLLFFFTGLFPSPEKARFKLYRLEIRLPRSETYSVPANIDIFREKKGFTVENIFDSYQRNCQELGIQHFTFDPDSDVYRELYKMQLIWLGVYPYPGYRQAAIRFYEQVEGQLEEGSKAHDKFCSLFKRDNKHITNLWDFVQDFLSRRPQSQGMDIQKVADFVASLESYNKRFMNTKYLKKEEWSHPAYLFYQLDFYKERLKERYDSIFSEIEAKNPSLKDQVEIILLAYERGFDWLKKAALFFLEDEWFYDERQQKFSSVKDILAQFWEPALEFVPGIKPGILRLGEVDGTSAGAVPFMEYPHLLKPLNTEGEGFLKETSPSEICTLFESIGETVPEVSQEEQPEGTMSWPLSRFIYSLENWEERVGRFTEAYDVGCPLTMLIANMPHEIAHTFHYRQRCYWKKEYAESQTIYYMCITNYINEGLAELCQIISLEPILSRFPMLRHDNLLKHYIFGQKDEGNHHTWGFLWMETIYEILGKDFKKLFFLATKPGVTLEELMSMPELQTEELLSFSRDTSQKVFYREKRKRDHHTYMFPSIIIELEGDAFRVVS